MAGDLQLRLQRNLQRLEEPYYQPEGVVKNAPDDWPGDFEGRLLLGLTMLAQGLHEEPPALSTLLASYPARMNDQGYFGPIQDVRQINEQQLSGNAWVLRGLCEYALWKKDAQTYDMVRRMATNLALPLRGFQSGYPIDPAKRTHGGGVNGTVTSAQGNWKLSSDIGCDFIFMDGVTAAAELLRDPRLDALAEEMAQRFLEIDLVQIKAQTHATLTSLRALLRMYQRNHDSALLQAVRVRYATYRKVAMTENYENYNWFGRPEWTEPCAYIDSYMVATQLWQLTGEPQYLEDAHHIYFNAIGRGQRSNGGFGTDTCSGARDAFVAIHWYESPGCCTMRGGEGLARAAQYAYFLRGDEIDVPFFYSSEAHLKLNGGTVVVHQTTKYPYEGKVDLTVARSTVSQPIPLRLFAPSWGREFRASLDGKPLPLKIANGFAAIKTRLQSGDRIAFRFEQPVTVSAAMNENTIPGYQSCRQGPLVLGIETTQEQALPPDALQQLDSMSQDSLLKPINDVILKSQDPTAKCRRQILFKS
ncbi:MAG: hypothetical protein ABR956_05055 [Terracidiphilus sp.]|jgi:hypothetical protein